MRAFLTQLESLGELQTLETPLDIHLEIPHLAYLEAKKPQGGKALLCTKPMDAKNNKHFDIPVLINLFGSSRRMELVLGKPISACCVQLEALLSARKPKNLKEIWHALRTLKTLYHIFPKISNKPTDHINYTSDQVNLYDLPILTTWERDAAPFITMGQIYTQSLDGAHKNLGLYRLQVYDKNHLGLHWQIHKDGNHFFHAYKRVGRKMPVSVVIGGDPLYTWCGQAPLPHGMFELWLYGLLRGKRAHLMRSRTNPICVPRDGDIIIEGWVDPEQMRLEGPFGDHTGFYTPQEPYPLLEVSMLRIKPDPIYLACVVGKPPLEDKYMGYLTERLFLPLIQKSTYGLLDYHMPENGVFHNLILAQIAPSYPAHASQIMHHFWGTGQMSFVKHAIFVGPNAPSLQDYPAIFAHILNHFDPHKLVVSEGVCDALDHASPNFAFGGKLGIDATMPSSKTPCILEDSVLLARMQAVLPQALILRQYGIHTANPLCVVGVQKTRPLLNAVHGLKDLQSALSIIIFVDALKNDLNNPYMLLWRITNNLDAKRDLKIEEGLVFLDATDKSALEGHTREWPLETDCSLEVLQKLSNLGLIPPLDDPIYHRYHIYNSPSTKESHEFC
ncbi:menaquinone biosynthesis decarboxylase [Helicobacter salomonis]|uniref:menaquinone biosynthesis decarboxylase n=1 Tax=Helicobacter salomonis TaxID=56878 RepID=UPI000CF12EC6|nr:menaquinone biosynthesis decarboxylase [Helicobacter salomonis]